MRTLSDATSVTLADFVREPMLGIALGTHQKGNKMHQPERGRKGLKDHNLGSGYTSGSGAVRHLIRVEDTCGPAQNGGAFFAHERGPRGAYY